jgi:hypothetical protein
MKFDYLHRRDGDTEIYFVCNPSNRWENIACAFRVTEKSPELWLPDTGEIRRGVVGEEKGGRTVVPLRLEPYGSAFVVFRPPSKTVPIAAVTREGSAVFATSSARDLAGVAEVTDRAGKRLLQVDQPGRYEVKDVRGRVVTVTIPPLPAPRSLDAGWVLHVPSQEPGSPATRPVALESLKSWTEFDDAGLKYFSGTLEYTCEVELAADTFGSDRRLTLDFGSIHEIAEVQLNGRNLGTLWKPPFCVDITSAAKPGRNQLVVRVTNFWPNRLIGDQMLPENQRTTRTNIRKFTRTSPLMPSGLIGPVRLVTLFEQELKFPD